MVGFWALCNRWLSSGDILVADRDWEDDLIDQMVEMFKGMGMSLSKNKFES